MKKLILFSIFISIFTLSHTKQTQAQTTVSGDVSGTWALANSPYYVIDDCTVPSSQTLTIEPGVEVFVGEGLSLNVLGTIMAIGTESQHIIFTSPNDTIFWKYIYVNYSGTISEFEYCDISNAQRGIYLRIYVYTNSMMVTYIRNCNFSDCIESGVYGYVRGLTTDATGGGWAYPYLNPIIYGCVFDRTVNGCIFSIDGYNGKWMQAYGHASPVIINNIYKNLTNFAFNTYTTNRGGPSYPVFTNNTIVNCRQGIFIQEPYDMEIRNNIFDSCEVAVERTGDLSSSLSNNCFFETDTAFIGYPSSYGNIIMQNYNNDPCDVAFNIFLNPLFSDTIKYNLLASSPCIDAGDGDTKYNDNSFPPSQGTVRNDIGATGGLGGDLPAAPTNPQLTVDSETQLSLSWTDNSNNEHGFEIQRSTTSGSGFSLIHTTGVDVTNYVDTGLETGTTYYYKIRSTNFIGQSSYTEEVFDTTLDVLPNTPDNLLATADSDNEISLSWTDNSNNEDGFEIQRSLTSGTGFNVIDTTTVNVTTYTDIGLAELTIYFYKIRSINSIGPSSFSSEASDTTLDVPPVAPENLQVSIVSESQLSLSWTDNSDNEEGFEIFRSTTSGTGFSSIDTTVANETIYADMGLEPGITYFYKLRAINSNSSEPSPFTDEVSASTLEVLPIEPSDLLATANSDRQITLNWSDNSNNETCFEIHRSATSGTGFTLIDTTVINATTYVDDELTPLTTYYYKIRSKNSVGFSSYTDETSDTTYDVALIAPDNLFAATDSENQISLTWDDNSGNEAGFEIYRSTTSGSAYTAIDTTAANETTYIDMGLTDGTTYFYKVRAINSGSAGPSSFTAEVSATTLDILPNAPGNLLATTDSESQISLSWTDYSENEDDFEIHRSTTSGTDFTLLYTAAEDETTYTDIGLTPGTTYFYKVRSLNTAGTSSFSDEASASTTNIPPIEPSDFIVSAGSKSRIDISWKDNSLIEDGFRVYSSQVPGEKGSVVLTLPTNVSSCSVEGLSYTTTYYYTVCAYNDVGEACTSQKSATTLSNSTPGVKNVSTCAGDQVADLIATGQNIKWYDDAALTNLLYEGNTFATGLTASGKYTYYVTQTVSSIESDAAMVYLYIYALPEVNAGDDFSACSSGFSLAANQAATGTGAWSIIDGTGSFSDENVPTSEFTTSSTGTVSLRWIITDANSCINSDDVVVTLKESPPIPTIHLKGGYIFICTDEFMNSYKWYKDGLPIPDAVKQYFLAEKPVTGVYAVEIGFENGCKSKADYASPLKSGISLDETIHVFPVPSSKIITVKMDNDRTGKVWVKLLGQSGELYQLIEIEKEYSKKSFEVGLIGLRPGYYYIEFIFETNERVSKKILKL